ncbi:hypothetical protein AGDE_15571 [Angomonas deanei]|uniref:Uncharacterized protein n=1 Tax=Angomonas deanei TaxID=59799 RepID=A0A7G2BYJ0_9TRYP|nr:hypothetical protein AGDE_15571 [Angomonas deanei]CAD2212659.1 hypothetical protein, conserved [Angomonas deanei]|eukprot:EPY18834.1 hypothetical protein AGDE_15571 [Angomonas deanei]
MVSESLIGTRCRININLKSTKGVIVGIDEQKRKIHVQIENSSTAREEEDFDGDEEDEEEDDNLSDGTTEDELNRPFDTNIQQELKEAFYTGTKTDKMADVRVPIGSSTKADPLPQMSRPGDEVIRTFDASDVKIRSKPGRIQLHINGMRFSVFNATGKYRDLVNPGGNNAQKKKPSEVDTFEKLTLKEKLVKTFKKKLVKKETDLDGENGNGLPAEIDPKVVAARKIQVNKLKNKTLHQKLFSFISSVEIELFTSIIDIGGAGASHPYFLHTSFQRGEGRVFLTRDGCPTLDLYRTVTELTLDNVDIRMAQMDSKLTETQFMRNTSLRDRAQLLFRGRDSTLGHDFDTTQSSDLIRNFGIVVDGKHRSKAHIVFYKDTPNIYGGEEVVRGKLPHHGV